MRMYSEWYDRNLNELEEQYTFEKLGFSRTDDVDCTIQAEQNKESFEQFCFNTFMQLDKEELASI